jgi:WbqC-like protein family
MASTKERHILDERCLRIISKSFFLESISFISPSFLFPPVSFFSEIRTKNLVLIDLHENYQKRSYRNRYDILTSNGKQSLSIPLKKGKNEKQRIDEVLISYDENWPNQHLHAIQSAYGKSPYFEHYYPLIESLIKNRFEKLVELNDASLRKLLKTLRLNVDVASTSMFIPDKHSGIFTEKRYPQVFEHKFDSTKNLSIIDLLFNTGPEAPYYL